MTGTEEFFVRVPVIETDEFFVTETGNYEFFVRVTGTDEFCVTVTETHWFC